MAYCNRCKSKVNLIFCDCFYCSGYHIETVGEGDNEHNVTFYNYTKRLNHQKMACDCTIAVLGENNIITDWKSG